MLHGCRVTCQAELRKVAERTTERTRLLTLCSTAANAGRLYDSSAINRLSECTAWINRTRQAVVKAMVLAARNTRLGTAPVRRQSAAACAGVLSLSAAACAALCCDRRSRPKRHHVRIRMSHLRTFPVPGTAGGRIRAEWRWRAGHY